MASEEIFNSTKLDVIVSEEVHDLPNEQKRCLCMRTRQHEKIIRGSAIGVAFIFYGKQEQSDGIVATLLAEEVHNYT